MGRGSGRGSGDDGSGGRRGEGTQPFPAQGGRGAEPGWGQASYGSPYAPPPGAAPPPWARTQDPPPGPAPFPGVTPTTGRGRGRPWLIVLVAFLVQLGVIAAVGNTWSVRKGFDLQRDHDGLLGAFGTVPSVFAWRLTPLGNDSAHFYAAMLAGLLTLLVVAALLTTVLVRGPITFGRAFVAVWLAVIVATLVGGMVRRAVIKDVGQYYGPGGKPVVALFRGGGSETVGGVLLGLLAGLVAGIVAVISRRAPVLVAPVPPAPEVEPHSEPEAPPPWYGDQPGHQPQGQPAQPSQPPAMQKVQQSVGSTPPPVTPPPAPSRPGPSAADSQQTTQFAAIRPDENPGGAANPAPTASGPRTEASIEATPDGSRAAPVNRDDATTQLPRLDQFRAPGGEQRRAEPAAQPPAEPAAQPPAEPAAEPAAQPPAEAPAPPPAGTADQPTQHFPRPPDDEDLGHHPD